MSSASRLIKILDLLAAKGALGVRSVAQQLTLPLGSVHRLLLDLAEENVVERNEDGAWQLSYRLLAITDRHLAGMNFPRLVRPFCEAIAEATSETLNINVLNGHSSVCVEKVRGSQGMQLDWPIGSRGPLHCGGAGKAMLAFMSEASQDNVVAHALARFTPSTITDPALLRAELARTRQRGYAIDDQEIVVGIFCIGVPVFDRLGRPVGAISISGPSPKAPGEAIKPLFEMLKEASDYASKRLGLADPNGIADNSMVARP